MKYFLDKFRNAFKGLKNLIFDKSVLIQEVIAILVISFFSFLKVDYKILIFVIILCALVILAEMINTCLEQILDFICPHYDENVRKIKDMGAGFVLFMALIALVIGLGLLFIVIK